MAHFYCQNIVGRQDFSIEEWNRKFELGIAMNLSKEERTRLLGDSLPPCEEQCFECMAIVGETRVKNKKL